MSSTSLLTNITFIVFIIISTISIIVSVCVGYSLRQFNHFCDTLVFKQRYPVLVRGICYLIIFNLAIRTPLLYFLISDIYSSHDAYILMVIIEGFFYSFASHGMIWLNLTRYWLIYYQFQFNHSTIIDSWKLIINSQNRSSSNKINWFKKHKTTYGTLKYVSKRAFVAYLISAIIDFSLLVPAKLYNVPEFAYFILSDGFLYLTPLSLTIVLYKYTPNFQDYVFIKQELKALSLFLTVAVALTLLLGLADNFYDDIWLTSMLANILLIFTMSGVAYIETFWLLRKLNIDPASLRNVDASDFEDVLKIIHKQIFDQSYKISHAIGPNTNLELKAISSASHSSNSHTQTPDDDELIFNYEQAIGDDILLARIISNSKLYDLFIIHLTKEYNSECLLSLTEFIQFKEYLLLNKGSCISQYASKDSIKCILVYNGLIALSLPKNMPKSSIVYNNIQGTEPLNINKARTSLTFKLSHNEERKDIDFMGEDKFKKKCENIMHQLYRKYIEENSEYEINISYTMRQELKEYIIEPNLDILHKNMTTFSGMYQVFDGAIDEMFTLMTQSCTNFCQTFDFLQFKDKWLKKMMKRRDKAMSQNAAEEQSDSDEETCNYPK